MSCYNNFGPDRFSRLTFIGYKQTDKKAKFINRLVGCKSINGNFQLHLCATSTKFFTFFLIWPNIQIICVGSMVGGLLGAPELKIIGKVFTVFSFKNTCFILSVLV